MSRRQIFHKVVRSTVTSSNGINLIIRIGSYLETFSSRQAKKFNFYFGNQLFTAWWILYQVCECCRIKEELFFVSRVRPRLGSRRQLHLDLFSAQVVGSEQERILNGVGSYQLLKITHCQYQSIHERHVA